jgi:hypothetical protein
MFAVIIAFVTASTKKADLSLKGSVNLTAKRLSPLADPVDSADCYKAYKALVDRYVEETTPPPVKRFTSGGIKRNHLKGIEVKPLSTPETAVLITTFEGECLATKIGDKCAPLLVLLADINAVAQTPTDDNKLLFATDCKVDAPSGDGDGSGDNGLFSFKVNKIMTLISLVSTIFYFLY